MILMFSSCFFFNMLRFPIGLATRGSGTRKTLVKRRKRLTCMPPKQLQGPQEHLVKDRGSQECPLQGKVWLKVHCVTLLMARYG